MSKPRSVALLIDTSTSWGTRLIRGINQFAQEAGNWLIHVEPRGRYERFTVPVGWKGTGIIARINRQALADEIVQTGLPTVNVSWYPFDGPRIARCTVDEEKTGQLAAEYFLSNGFQNFAYCGPLGQPGYASLLAEAFRTAVEAAQRQCQFFVPPPGDQNTIPWNVLLTSQVKWLKQLPKPTALLCWSAVRGRQVTEACHYAGLRVPDEVAVLGGDFDDLMSSISHPPLSTIDEPAEQIGYAAAATLEKMMSGRQAAPAPQWFPPTRIKVRHSTDTLAIDDPLVRDALAYIRQRSPLGINVADVVRHLCVARRSLEQRFIKLLSRTPAAEIRRVRIEDAKRLLIESDGSIAEVAQAAGFSQQDLFSRTFRAAVGMPPREFRRRHKE